MTTNPDLDQAREWTRLAVAHETSEVSRAAARIIQSIPDEWIDADNLREALEWRASKPSGDDYDAEFYDRLRALLPDPPLPDPLFGARATHPDHGEGVVGSYHPDMGGVVRFMVRNSGSIDGTGTFWLNPRTLTFHAPDHPVFLKSEEDYASAPEGTIVASNDERPAVLVDELWRHIGHWTLDHDEMAGIRRRVLRWRWEA